MPVSPVYRPDPQFPALGREFADPVAAADFPAAILRYRNDQAAATVGLNTLSDDEWVAHFGRFRPLPGNIDPPIAQRYHGHQFRVYNPDLGDGRGFLFAQLREAGTDRLLDLGTKGSGQTPWSRQGDGRLTLKGGVREVLATAMLEALGVPTSRSFSLVETGEALQRGDEPSPTRSAVLVRLSHSHVRFGTFQRHAYFEAKDRVGALVDHVVGLYYPELEGANDRPAALLEAVCGRAARLTARWMAAGFVHGVMNTDNMNVTGESFDYGPYRFLPKSDPNFTAAYFDHSGLYSFGRQPEAVFWNLQQLAGCLSLVTGSDALVDALNGFGPAYRRELMAAMLARLGVAPQGDEADAALVQAAFGAMAEGGEQLRWEPFFFDWFGGREDRALKGPRADLYAGSDFAEFRQRLGAYAADRPERLDHPYFAGPEPEELLIDEIEAIWADIDRRDDWSALHAKLARIETARVAWDLSPAASATPTAPGQRPPG
ncbi:MAG: selenoprotein O [Phenylobacterium sp. RIFCSPHIGHO2_01_FULL_69_31]|uniref:protein adenylyltransferase SelO n=1 Tax=Phenylobacterium sp. RIFCSPHIGHO2_01_FULL_69_31 TaxID=1801944 RepID=UPI0008AE7B10|nr:YdiU family protein [Phenylobacterium sp. RIFCSPHIGHO2_01_FULL_69_31]OHB26207.1 MAG: selenoprotein O [Phenylobacterium sp. RIFCSPHIGHO2_01_FULL_69_31]